MIRFFRLLVLFCMVSTGYAQDTTIMTHRDTSWMQNVVYVKRTSLPITEGVVKMIDPVNSSTRKIFHVKDGSLDGVMLDFYKHSYADENQVVKRVTHFSNGTTIEPFKEYDVTGALFNERFFKVPDALDYVLNHPEETECLILRNSSSPARFINNSTYSIREMATKDSILDHLDRYSHIKRLILLPGSSERAVFRTKDAHQVLGQLYEFKKLQSLGVYSGMYTFPMGVLELRDLRRLELIRMDSCIIPNGIKNLKDLVFLTIKCKKLVLPDDKYALQQLKYLDIQCKRKEFNFYRNGTVLTPKLEKLKIGVGADGVVKHIYVLRNLRYLEISSGKLPENISNLQNLETVAISSRQISSITTGVDKLKGLKHLILANSKIHSLPESIFELPELQNIIFPKSLPQETLEMLSEKYPELILTRGYPWDVPK